VFVTVVLLFMCSFIQFYYYSLLVSKLGVIIALIFMQMLMPCN